MRIEYTPRVKGEKMWFLGRVFEEGDGWEEMTTKELRKRLVEMLISQLQNRIIKLWEG